MQLTCNDLAGQLLAQQRSQAVLQLASGFVAEGDDHHFPWLAALLLDQILYPGCQHARLATARSRYDPAADMKLRKGVLEGVLACMFTDFMFCIFACAIAKQNGPVHGMTVGIKLRHGDLVRVQR